MHPPTARDPTSSRQTDEIKRRVEQLVAELDREATTA
jgi:hypothetical protein